MEEKEKKTTQFISVMNMYSLFVHTIIMLTMHVGSVFVGLY